MGFNRKWLILTMLAGTACSTRKVAVNQMGPVLLEASDLLHQEKSWAQFKAATPGSLQLMETLLQSSKDNFDLLFLLAKGHAAYGFAVHDTEALKDRLTQSENSPARAAASQSFAKGLKFGLRYLALKGIDLEDITKAGNDEKMMAVYDSQLDRASSQDIDTMFYTGLAWLMLANLNRDQMTLISQLTSAHSLIEWVCKNEPGYQKGLCPTLTAVFHLARPKMLGGKPEEAKAILEKAIKAYPENFLVKAIYQEWYLIPFSDKMGYTSIKKNSLEPLAKIVQTVEVPGEAAVASDPMLNLFNAMALERMNIMAAQDATLF